MENDTGDKKVPPEEEQLDHMTHLSLESPKSREPNAKATEVDLTTDESPSPTNPVEPPAENANAFSDLKNGLETELLECKSTDPEDIVDAPEEGASTRYEFKMELNTVPEVNLNQSPEDDRASAEAECLGPPRQCREGLQRASDDFMAMEAEEDSDQSIESQTSSSYEENQHGRIPDWQDDESDDDPDATVDENIPHQQNEMATEYDWQKEDYISREEWSDKA